MLSTGPSRGCKSLVDQLGHSARQLASPREVTHSEMVMMMVMVVVMMKKKIIS